MPLLGDVDCNVVKSVKLAQTISVSRYACVVYVWHSVCYYMYRNINIQINVHTELCTLHDFILRYHGTDAQETRTMMMIKLSVKVLDAS